MRPGSPQREDYDYVREGTVSGFMIASPLEGKRKVFVAASGRRTAIDYALAMQHLAEVIHPDAEKIVLVQDNLNTHKTASFYEAFPAAQARALAQRFEFHYTPKHGSWLNIAEIEISALNRMCLKRRIESGDEYVRQTEAYSDRKNQTAKPVSWQFTCENARTKLKSLCPAI